MRGVDILVQQLRVDERHHDVDDGADEWGTRIPSPVASGGSISNATARTSGYQSQGAQSEAATGGRCKQPNGVNPQSNKKEEEKRALACSTWPI